MKNNSEETAATSSSIERPTTSAKSAAGFETHTEDATDFLLGDVSPNDHNQFYPEVKIGKVKNFLRTVYQHGCEAASPPLAGLLVKNLIVNLVEAKITAADFFKELQSSLKIPVRPYLVPSLREGLALIRTQHTSEMQKEKLWKCLFTEKTSPNGAVTQSQTRTQRSPNVRSKRKLQNYDSPIGPAAKLSAATWHPVAADRAPMLRDIEKLPETFGSLGRKPVSNGNACDVANSNPPFSLDLWSWYTDEWRQIENLFNSLVSTMEKLRYAMLLFQQRARLSQVWTQQQLQQQQQQNRPLPEVQIEEVQRKTDAAVQEVKRVAVLELQKAISAAEQKAFGMVSMERARMEKIIRDTQIQEAKTENCWNCGRRAGQTCGGCGVARYCGTFCQHKDWTVHKTTCAQQQQSPNNGSAVKHERPCSSSSTVSLRHGRSTPKSV